MEGGGAAKYIPAVVIVLRAGMCNQSCFLTRAGGGPCCFFSEPMAADREPVVGACYPASR